MIRKACRFATTALALWVTASCSQSAQHPAASSGSGASTGSSTAGAGASTGASAPTAGTSSGTAAPTAGASTGALASGAPTGSSASGGAGGTTSGTANPSSGSGSSGSQTGSGVGNSGADGGATGVGSGSSVDAGTSGDAGTPALGTIGAPCSPSGAGACAGHAQTLTLICTGNPPMWMPSTRCASGQLCDSRPGTYAGTCAAVDALCTGLTPGAVICHGAGQVVACGADLVTENPVQTCGSHQTCTAGGGNTGAMCSCTPDPACSAMTASCDNAQPPALCAQDAQGCWYHSACSTGLVCNRVETKCINPSWAEWPVANGAVDVDAGAPNPQHYTDNGDGTVTDTVTGLMWQQTPPTQSVLWFPFNGVLSPPSYCAALGLGAHHDWRLPAKIELESLVDYDNFAPALDTTSFPGQGQNMPVWGFWSSTVGSGISGGQWVVEFVYGGSHLETMRAMHWVRCVR